MPLNSRSDRGTLFVVSTPLGHPEDITLRALNILGTVDAVVCEDTRETGRFLAGHGIRQSLISFYQPVEAARLPGLLDRLERGENLALVTDAGTPGISDPGFVFVREAVDRNLAVVPVPGPVAAMAALSVSGLPTDSFHFVGFLPKAAGKRKTRLAGLALVEATLIFYESPRRIVRLVAELEKALGDRRAVLAREVTKTHEEFVRGAISDIGRDLSSRSAVRGECTLVVAGCPDRKVDDGRALDTDLDEKLDKALSMALYEDRLSPSAAAAAVAREFGLTRKRVYEKAMDVKNRKGR